MAEVGEHVHHAGLRKAVHRHLAAKARQRRAGFSVERDEEEARGGDIDHAAAVDFIVGDAFAVVGAHRVFPSAGVGQAVAPQGFAAGRVDGDDVAPVAGEGEQFAVDIARCGAPAHRAHAGAVPDPGDFELVEVVGGDLGRFGVAGLGEVVAQGEPLHCFLGGWVLGGWILGVLGEKRAGAKQHGQAQQDVADGAMHCGWVFHCRPRGGRFSGGSNRGAG